MWNELNNWFQTWRLKRAGKLVQRHGYNIVRIVDVAGTQYIQTNDGQLLALRGKKK